jgi:hypothetical protein
MFSPIFINAKGGDPEKSETNRGSEVSDDAGDSKDSKDVDDSGGSGDSGDTGGSGDTGDVGDSGDTGGSGDTGDVGELGDPDTSLSTNGDASSNDSNTIFGDTLDNAQDEESNIIEVIEDLEVDLDNQEESGSELTLSTFDTGSLQNIFFPYIQSNLLYLLILLLTTFGSYKLLQKYSSEENEII